MLGIFLLWIASWVSFIGAGTLILVSDFNDRSDEIGILGLVVGILFLVLPITVLLFGDDS